MLYCVSRGRIPGWRERGYNTELASHNKEIANDFENVFALNDAIMGQISTVNGITHLILAKDGSDCVGVKFFSCAMAGKLCIRDNREKEHPHPIINSISLTLIDISRTRVGAKCLNNLPLLIGCVASARLQKLNLQCHHQSGAHLVNHLPLLQHDASVHL